MQVVTIVLFSWEANFSDGLDEHCLKFQLPDTNISTSHEQTILGKEIHPLIIHYMANVMTST